MSPTLARKTAAAVVACVLLSLVALLLWPRPVGTIGVRLAGLRQVSNSVWLVTVVLTNGTPHTFNVVDDTAGKPLFLLDAGTGGWPPGSGNYGLSLGYMANQHRVNLAPGASLTHTVCLTNPPPRFRLRVIVNDMTAARRGFPLYRIVGRTLATKVVEWQLKRQNIDAVLPASVWIQPGAYHQ